MRPSLSSNDLLVVLSITWLWYKQVPYESSRTPGDQLCSSRNRVCR